jgi:hypothetical protein
MSKQYIADTGLAEEYIEDLKKVRMMDHDTVKTPALSNLHQRALVDEIAEVQGSTLMIYKYMKEIEVLVHRLVICAPHFTGNQPNMKQFVEDWGSFAERQWDYIKHQSIQDNPLGV